MAKKSILEFEVESLDPRVEVMQMVPKAQTLASNLEKTLAAQYFGTTVRIERAEGLPIHAAIQHLLVHIDWANIEAGALKGATAFATSQLLELLKKKLSNLFVKPAPQAKPKAKEASKKKSAPAKKKQLAKKKGRR